MLTVTSFTSMVWAQAPGQNKTVSAGQLLSAGAGAILISVPTLTRLNEHPPDCAPCDPSTLPWFDRWAVNDQNGSVSDASTVLGLGLAAATWVDLGTDGGGRALATSAEAVAWAAAATEWGKALIGRKRPVLYTDAAPDEASNIRNQRSMPSGHTSVAFALATSYILYTWDRRDNKTPALLAGAAAVSVGVLRVVAARHFPSDVLVGAAVGTLSGIVVYSIRY